jgi:replicative DNA helicase
MRLSIPVFRLKRQAKLLAREKDIPLSAALNQIAGHEGFRSWSHLAAAMSRERPAGSLLSQFNPGDLVLLGARPGHGKTLLGLELIVEAIRQGRAGFFFTLEYHDADVLHGLRSLGVNPKTIGTSFTLDTSDDICADHVIARLRQGPKDAIAVIDYLQLLDQRRQNPELADQIGALSAYAKASGSIIVVLSQIDRSFDLRGKQLPELSDVRLPNPLALTLFTKTCFMHDGEVRLEAVA